METHRAAPEPDIGVFGAVAAGFDAAQRRHAAPPSVADHRFAGHVLRLRLVGRELAARVPAALAHLRVGDAASPGLLVDLWDEAACGVTAPLAPGDFEDAGTVWHLGDGGLLISAEGGRVIGHHLRGATVWLDRQRQHIVGSVPSAADMSLHQRGKPLQALISVWATDRGLQPLHAAAVARGNRGVLFPGRGGSGKSTCALACAAAGFDYLGDDWVALETLPGGSFAAHSLYSSAWLDPLQAARSAAILPAGIAGSDPQELKLLLLLAEAHRFRFAASTRIAAIALPRIADTCRLRPASRAEALFALAPSSILELRPRQSAAALERLAKLVEAVPAFWIDLGRDLDCIPPLIAGMLSAECP